MIIHVDLNDNENFWFYNSTIERIISELSNTGSVTVKFNTEGPCVKTLGLYDFLERISKILNISHDKIEIQTHNQSEFHPTFKITKFPLAHSLPTVQNEIEFCDSKHLKNFYNKDLKHFGCFVGRNSWDRLWISSYLYKNYKNQTTQTYHLNAKDTLVLERSNLGIDSIISNSKKISHVKNAVDFLAQCPLLGPDNIERYPITVDSFLGIDSEYCRFFSEIVCETYTKGNAFFPTEKTWRPIALKTPFIVNGSFGFLNNLKKLGFRTFDKWWDESYDYNRNEARIEKIFNIIDYISTLSRLELNTMYNEMHDVLEHNYSNLYKLTPKDFKNAFHY